MQNNMELLPSPHPKENLSKVLRTSYNIYNSIGFIGFCVIYNNEKSIQASILLFETISVEQDQQSDSGKNYPLHTSDVDILRDLMSLSISLFGENGEKYVAHNANAIYHIE